MQWCEHGYSIFQVVYLSKINKMFVKYVKTVNSQFIVSPPVFSADRCSSVSQSSGQVSLAYERARLTGASLHQR